MRSIATLEEKCPRLLTESPELRPTIELIGIDPDHRSRSRSPVMAPLISTTSRLRGRLIRVSADQINTSEGLIKESEE